MYRPTFKVNSTSADDRKIHSGINRRSLKTLSPSQKVIREYKKSEVNKYIASPSCTEIPRTSTREWQVLYTTQLTQKSKKYHDGFLKLAICGAQGRQVMLYDATRRLLDSRFLKKDETVKSGESITLDGHLVDVGELEEENKPLTNLSLKENKVNCTGETEILHGQQIKRLKMHKSSPMELNNRSGINGFGESRSCPDTSSTNEAEWEVLYTTQLTQKAKKFQDGVLKVAVCGPRGRQVFLYDENGRLLDSRFLKSNENIRSDESLKLDGHLVEIGELKGKHEPRKEINLPERDCYVVGETGIPQEQIQSQTSSPIEWDAMYTSQTTQKSKKYHSGILRLASCGSYRMQATLLAEDGTTLSRRYLKLSEHLSSGSTFGFPNYLVEVGELRKHHDGNLQNNAFVSHNKASEVKSCVMDKINISKRVLANKISCDGIQNKDLLRKEPDSVFRSSGAVKIKPSSEIFTNKPLRDAHSILSILKKPATREGFVSVKRESLEECHVLQTSDVHLDVQNSLQKQLVEDSPDRSSLMEDRDGDIIGIAIISTNSRGDPQLDIPTSSTSSLCDNSRRPTFNTLDPQTIDDHFDCQPLVAFVPHDGLNGKNEITNISESISFRAASNISSSQTTNEVKSGKLPELSADNLESDSRCCKAFDSSDVGVKNPSTIVTDDWPSFDLGF